MMSCSTKAQQQTEAGRKRKQKCLPLKVQGQLNSNMNHPKCHHAFESSPSHYLIAIPHKMEVADAKMHCLQLYIKAWEEITYKMSCLLSV